MFNKKWKMIAAFAASFSMALASGGVSTLVSAAGENAAVSGSTLDIAGGDEADAAAAASDAEDNLDSGSLLDLAQSMDATDTADEATDGLLALIDAQDEAPAAQEEAPSTPDANDAAAEEEPAGQEEQAGALAEAAPEQETAGQTAPEPQAEPAPQEGGAVLQTPAQEEPVQTEAAETEEEPVHYEKLSPTGSATEGITTLDVSNVVETVMPSIVAVTSTSVQTVRSYFSIEPYEIEGTGAGSGIIISQNDTELLIATNYHVTNGSKDLTVCFSVDAEDEKDLVVPAVLKGETNRGADIAVLAVKLSDIKPEIYSQLKVATLGSSDKLKVGEAAIVIGNALGFGQTVSTGIISALNRDVQTEVGNFTEFMTDASINLGCSGGAILNKKGEVVGIVNAKDVGDYAEGMGYGIPIDTAIPILQEMINRETRETVEKHGYLGITVVPVSEEASSMYSMPEGAYVYEVAEGSAAEQAGIVKGNIITAFDGIPVGSSDDLVNRISYYEVGETVKVTMEVLENSSYVTKEVEVTLQAGAEEDTEEEQKQEDADAPKQEEPNDALNMPEDNGGQNGYYDPSQEGYGYYYGQDNYGQNGFGDPFSWFFGGSGRGNDDGWGSFYFGN